MLYAELRGKLAANQNDHEQREDILTSTVFGTLLLADARGIIAAWFREARGVEGQELRLDSGEEPFEVWFWPRLGREPDLLLRIGTQLIVVEVKYRSRLSDTGLNRPNEPIEDEISYKRGEPDGAVTTQLVEEWRCCSRSEAYYPDGILRAIGECELSLIYLVDARDARRARQELDKSRTLLPMGRFLLLTWQDLHRLLGARVDRSTAGHVGRRWAHDLHLLLERRSLAAFRGCSSHIPGGLAVALEPIAARAMRLAARRFVCFARTLEGLDSSLAMIIRDRARSHEHCRVRDRTWANGLPRLLPVFDALASWRRLV